MRSGLKRSVILFLVLGLATTSATAAEFTGMSIPEVKAALLAAYPEHLEEDADPNSIRWRADGSSMPIENGLPAVDPGDDVALGRADLFDQLLTPYPTGLGVGIPPENDAGRARYEAFFRKMYGNSPLAVSRQLAPVKWLSGATIFVTRVNDVHVKLQRVSDDLKALPPAILRAFLLNPSDPPGTFNWRKIAGTSRLSMHSFAIAIDIAVGKSDYWKSGKRGPGGELVYRNRIPVEIADVFERHGFIWGGKWKHYDTMHFEYRPELLLAR